MDSGLELEGTTDIMRAGGAKQACTNFIQWRRCRNGRERDFLNSVSGQKLVDLHKDLTGRS